MATKSISAQKHDIDRQHQRSHAETERLCAVSRISKPQRLPYVVGQNQNESERQIEKVPMHSLHDQRKRPFAPIRLPRLANGAGRRVCPEGFVIRAAIIITGEPKSARRPQDEKRGRKRQQCGPPSWLRPKPAVWRIPKQFRRVKWRNVVAEIVVHSLKCGPRRRNEESSEAGED